MTNQITLSATNTTLPVLTWNKQTVITLAMVDDAHKRPDGTASRNFQKNRQYFIEGEDYFHLTHNEMALLNENRRVNKSSQGVIVFTLAGYMMLAKSLTDALAWQVQRELVNGYFKQLQTAPQWEEVTLNDLLSIGHFVEKTLIEVTHTKKGEIISVDALEQKSDPDSTKHQEPTTPHKPAWIPIVETLFTEIGNKNIPEKMRQNMLITNEVITSATGKRERHACLFFRASNVMAFFRKDPRFFDLMNVSLINTAQDLLAQLDKAGVLAYGKKTKEKGIPMNPKTPSEVRRVPHLVALDLAILEQDYGMVMSNSGGIAKTLQ
jgi:hypothetical protein